uniref:Uncharacterized protein n=1 Tax=Rhizophora mucronata TaxID=61149 RepID=A0A2P2QDS3_RHIMU
MKVRTRRPSWR